jgi:membrane protein
MDAARSTSWLHLCKDAWTDFLDDKAPQLGAALAYYTVFSLAPLLVIIISVAGMVFDAKDVQTQLDTQLQGFLGSEGAAGVQAMVAAANEPKRGTVAIVVGVVAMIFGATGVFIQMQDSLNTIWEVPSKAGSGVWGFIKSRLLSFGIVLAICFLLLVTMVVSAFLAALSTTYSQYIPGPVAVAHGLDVLVSLLMVSGLFAIIFKYLPDVQIAWRDVWFGAFITAVLFVIGKYAIGVYLGTAGIGSSYGAAGSLVIVLLWAYYSSQIFFFGAELTQAYATQRGSHIGGGAKAAKRKATVPGVSDEPLIVSRGT